MLQSLAGALTFYGLRVSERALDSVLSRFVSPGVAMPAANVLQSLAWVFLFRRMTSGGARVGGDIATVVSSWDGAVLALGSATGFHIGTADHLAMQLGNVIDGLLPARSNQDRYERGEISVRQR